jgi:hypothetical protein
MEADWWHTEKILAQVYNFNRGKNKPPSDDYKFHPFAKKPPPREATKEDLEKIFGTGICD